MRDRCFMQKKYFLLCVRTDIIFFSQNKSQWSRLSFKMLLIEYTSEAYHKLLKTLPYKELNRNLSANFDKMKIGKKPEGYVKSEFNLINQSNSWF